MHTSSCNFSDQQISPRFDNPPRPLRHKNSYYKSKEITVLIYAKVETETANNLYLTG